MIVDDIIELILEDMDCHHQWNRDEDGTHISTEYSLKNEERLRNKIVAIIKSGKE